MGIQTTIGKALATLGIGTVCIAQALPVAPEWKSFANAVGLALTAMSVYLLHDVNGKNNTSPTPPALP